MRPAAGGAILNVCSLTWAVGVPTAVPYTSSKSGLLGMTRALAAEWAGAEQVLEAAEAAHRDLAQHRLPPR